MIKAFRRYPGSFPYMRRNAPDRRGARIGAASARSRLPERCGRRTWMKERERRYKMGRLTVKNNVIGPIGTNCYIIFEEGKKEAVVIDPAADGAFILAQCRKLGVEPAAILLTHGHGDHIGGVLELKRALEIPVYAGEAERALLADPALNLSPDLGGAVSVKGVEGLQDGQELFLLGHKWQAIATPGHTAGGVCFYLEEDKLLFSGDTLFHMSYGRTDFPTGDTRALIRSITEKLLVLPEDVVVYPGHESQTTIGDERRYNPLAGYLGR